MTNYNDDVPMLQMFEEELRKTGVISQEFRQWLIGMGQRIEAEGYERGKKKNADAIQGESAAYQAGYEDAMTEMAGEVPTV